MFGLNLNMAITPNFFVKLYIVIFLLVIGYISFKVYEQVVFVQKQRQQLTRGFYNPTLEDTVYEDDVQKKFKQRKINAQKIMKMKAIIKQLNMKQKMYNRQIHKQPKFIVVIQVHSNLYLFQQLLNSLKSAYGIYEALLIFSHDVFDPEINKAVRSVNFAKYIQIFYPYSIQLHPNVFPGVERESKDGKITEQSKLRDPAAAQTKHHWWWQVNQVFDYLNVTKKYNKPILFLEEGNYVTIDFLIVFKILQATQINECQACEMISLGAHKPHISSYTENATITLEMWEKNTPNIGLAFSRSNWYMFKNFSYDFCYFNDFRWDNSLKYIGSKRLDTNIYLTAIDGPRVLRIDKCEESDLTCKIQSKVQRVIELTEKIHKLMFPTQVYVELKINNYFNVYPNGFFSDERDHELCMYFSKNNVWY